MRRWLKQLAEDTLFVMVTGFLAFIWYFVMEYEEVTIRESNPVIHTGEFIFLLAVLGFAIYQYVSHIRERRRS